MIRFRFIGILVTILTGAFAQLALKHGTGLTPINLSQPKQTLFSCITNPFLWLWFIFALLSAISWFWVVSRFELSFVLPIVTSAMLILVVLGSNLLFGETISVVNWLGIMLLCVGIFLVFQS